MYSYIQGYAALFSFYLRHLATFSSLPPWIRNPNKLKELFDQNSSDSFSKFSLVLPSTFASNYNKEYENLKEMLRKLHPDTQSFNYSRQLFLLFLIRLLAIVSAIQGNFCTTAALTVSQVLVAPYSLFAAITLFVAYAPPIYVAHYVSFSAITLAGSLCQRLAASWQMTQGLADSLADVCGTFVLPVGPTFIAVFFAVDQLLCLWAHHKTDGVKLGLGETMKHVVWGFINTKTFHLVVLLHLNSQQFSIPLAVWFIDYWFGLTAKVGVLVSSLWLDSEALFYHQHRMSHLPRVYEHGHKLHHYLHGTNAFDGAIYGHGMPEESIVLLIEIGGALFFGLTPALLNWFVILMSFGNKFSHIQKRTDCTGENYHALHHLLHIKNFGFVNCLTDMYFGTSHENMDYVLTTLSVPGEQAEVDVYDIQKSVEKLDNGGDGNVTFAFTLRK